MAKNNAGAEPQNTVRAQIPLEQRSLSASLESNIQRLEDLFQDVDIMLHRRFNNAHSPEVGFCIYFSDGVTDSMLINEHIIKPLLQYDGFALGPDLFEVVKDRVELVNDTKVTRDVQEIVESITYGDTLLLVEGADAALVLSSKSFSLRGIGEPEGEKVLSGPREGFCEGIMTNLSMVRRRLRTHELKMKFLTKGQQSRTTVCIAYMDNIVNKKLLKELYRRLDTMDLDAVLDTNYITEYIAEKSPLGFNTVGTTERPDVIAGKLLEGRIAIFADGTPVVLTVPYLFIENFQSNEDYYMSSMYTSYSRFLRILCFFFTIAVPSVYIAVVAYHHELIPTPLMLTFTTSRQNVPLPAALECFMMLIVFDILREAGVRMPGHVGQALSIVGALVIGQAAVEARLVAAPMIIIVAFAGITILMVPRLTTAALVARYSILILASALGLMGWMVGTAIFIIHIINLQSLGVPSLMPTGKLGVQEIKDTFVRAPWPKMLTRLTPMSANTMRASPRDESEPKQDQ